MALDRVYVKLHDGTIGFLTDHSSKMYRVQSIECAANIRYVSKKYFADRGTVLPDDEQKQLAEESLNNWLDSRR